MSRIIAVITFFCAAFCFISIVLINIGGVNPNDSTYLPEEANSNFKLLTWNLAITPTQSIDSYQYDLFLNRICPISLSAANNSSNSDRIINKQCIGNGLIGVLQGGPLLAAPNALVQDINPFRFDDVNLTVPLAFYILAALGSTISMIFALALGTLNTKQVTKNRAIIGLLLTAITFTFLLIASAVMTKQMTHLRHQILTETLSSVTVSESYTQEIGRSTTFQIKISSVSLGLTVFVLTWISVVLMAFDTLKYVWLFIHDTRLAGPSKPSNIQMNDG